MNQIVYGLSMGCELQVKLNSIKYLITQKEIRKPYKIEWNKEETNGICISVCHYFVLAYFTWKRHNCEYQDDCCNRTNK